MKYFKGELTEEELFKSNCIELSWSGGIMGNEVTINILKQAYVL